MKKIISLATLLSLALATPAHASEAQFGTITNVYGMNNGALLFTSSGSRTTPPSCHSSFVPQRWAIDASTVAGQLAASVFLTALALKKRVYVMGSATCTIWGDTETVTFINIEN